MKNIWIKRRKDKVGKHTMSQETIEAFANSSHEDCFSAKNFPLQYLPIGRDYGYELEMVGTECEAPHTKSDTFTEITVGSSSHTSFSLYAPTPLDQVLVAHCN